MSEPVRVFLGWDGPVLPRAAAWLLERHGRDQGDVVVVVPGRRSGRLLLAHLAAAAAGADGRPRGGEAAPRGTVAPRAGTGFVPPRVMTPGAVPELFYRSATRVADGRVRLLAWCAALEAAPRGSWPGAGPDGDFAARLAMARELVRVQDELGAEGLRLADVVDRAGAAISVAGEVERWHGLGRLELAARRSLERGGLLDPTSARLEALARSPPAAPGPTVVLCGLARVGGLERSFLERHAGALTSLIAASEDARGLFDDWGSVVPRSWQKRRVSLAPGKLIVVDRPRDQAAVVGRTAAAGAHDDVGAGAASHARARVGSERSPGERPGFTVGLADSSLAAVVREELARRAIAIHDAIGRPLAASAPWRLVEALGRYSESRSVRDLAALLRHPELERYLTPSLQAARASSPAAASRELEAALAAGDWLTALDFYAGETLLEAVTEPLPGDAAGAAMCRAADAALASELGTGAAVAPIGEWIGHLREVLLRVYAERALSDAEEDRRLRRALARLGEEMRAHAEAAGVYPDALRVRLGDAIALLVAAIDGETLAGEGEQGAIEVVGWLELPLDDAPRTVVAGLDQGPAEAARSDGLLGQPLRRSLGLPDAGTLHARDLYFLELLSRSRDATFVTGRRGAQGEPLAPRRILLAGAIPALVETVRAFWGGESTDGGEGGAGAASVAPGRGAFGPIVPRGDERIPDRLPVTAFRDYLACPYRFYLRHVLGLRQVRDLPRELQPGDFGRLLHAVLGRFARGPAAASADPEEIAGELEALLGEEVARRAGGRLRIAVRVQIEQLRRRLRAFARWQAAQTGMGWSIVPEHTEAALEAVLDVDGAPFTITGRVDRLDRHPQEGLRLLDYKSSEQSSTPEQAHRSGPRGERRWTDLQLPLYERMLRQRGLAGAVRLGFVNLGHRLGADALALAEWSAADLEQAIAVAAEVVRSMRARRFWPPGEPPAWEDGFEGLAGDAFPDRERWLAGG